MNISAIMRWKSPITSFKNNGKNKILQAWTRKETRYSIRVSSVTQYAKTKHHDREQEYDTSDNVEIGNMRDST